MMTSRLLLPFSLLVALVAPARAQAPDGGAGRAKATACIGCHGIPGYQASFPQVYKVPMIQGQGARYIAAALNAYRKGERKHPTMRAVAATLSDADIAELAAFYEAQGGPAPAPATPTPPPEVAPLLAKGACQSCHGANLSQPIDPGFPRIAGQHADYLLASLKAYATDGHPLVGRSNPIMAAQARQFTATEMKTLAQYLASLPGNLHSAPQSRFR